MQRCADDMSHGKTKIVIDCDPGADDAQAILMALNASHIEILAITAVFGNCSVENSVKNAVRLLTFCHRSDIPVFKGCESNLLMEPPQDDAYFGKDGYGDIHIPGVDPIDLSSISTEHASQALCRLVSEHPGSVILVILGPLTNIATCLKLDANFGKKLKDCIIMGGNYQGKGNVSIAAEHNFWKDPEAVQAVLNGLQRKSTVIPYETCLEHGATWQWYEEEYASGQTKLSALMRDIDHNAVTLLKTRKTREYFFWDQLAMAVLLEPKTVQKAAEVYASVELHGVLTRGQMVIDWENKLNKPANIRLVTNLDIQDCKDMMVRSINLQF